MSPTFLGPCRSRTPLWIARLPEVRVYKLTNLVSVPHPRKRKQQLRRQHLRDALEHNHGRRTGGSRELSAGSCHIGWGGARGEAGPTSG